MLAGRVRRRVAAGNPVLAGTRNIDDPHWFGGWRDLCLAGHFPAGAAIGVADFLAGGYIFTVLAGMIGLNQGAFSWIFYLIGGVVIPGSTMQRERATVID